MSEKGFDPKEHPDWLRPHSLEWYAQLARLTGKYDYSWSSTIEEPNGESAFTDEVSRSVAGKTVLDIGCGHGEYALRWSPVVRRIVGIDVTNDFVMRGNESGRENVEFLTANTKDGLPFADGEFDFAYNRRGPTSAYLDVKRVLRKGGGILGLHPGDRGNEELAEWFPDYFAPPPAGTPVRDMLRSRLQEGGFENAEIETLRSIEYLHAPIDLLRMSLFGQQPSVFEAAVRESLPELERIFNLHATARGLPIDFERYIVRATV